MWEGVYTKGQREREEARQRSQSACQEKGRSCKSGLVFFTREEKKQGKDIEKRPRGSTTQWELSFTEKCPVPPKVIRLVTNS